MMLKRFICWFFIIVFAVFFIERCRFIYAGERESVDDLLDKDHISEIKELGFFEHEHFLDFRLRNILEGKGLSFDLVYTADFVTNHSGGLKTNSDVDTSISYLSNTDLIVELDTEKAGLWNGGTFHAHFFNHHGAEPSLNKIGDLQIADNFETNKVTKVYEIWYEHSFDLYGTDLSFLIGLHDLNDEFNISEYGLLFINSSFGFNNEISNNIPVSNFPVAAPGIRVKWEPTEKLYFMAEISDGDPGRNEDGFNLKLSSSKVNFFELGYHFGDQEESRTMPGTYKLGGWYHSGKFDDVRDTDENDDPRKHDDNYGIYFIADQMLIPGEGKRGLGAFFQIGGVPDDRNEVDFYVGGGLRYQGIIPSREDDILGLAVAHASISEDLRDVEKRDSHETAVELTYRARIFPRFAIQPGVQTIFNPGADSSLDNAWVSIVRFEISF
ncbi:MAG: hypothetical protein GQ468_05180 [Candidatus Scalindua sp.]|nr:hypothetical protein [Candidatus Scalindua sp.]